MGQTNKKRFYLFISIGFLCSALLGVAMIKGAVATNISLSSSSMKVSADTIYNGQLQLYSGLLQSKRASDGATPTIFVHQNQVKIKNFCVLIHTGDIPIIGEYNLVIRSGLLTADYLNLRVTSIDSTIHLHNLSIGVDPPRKTDSLPPNTFSINADSGDLKAASLEANYISGDNVVLHDSKIFLSRGKNSCTEN